MKILVSLDSFMMNTTNSWMAFKNRKSKNIKMWSLNWFY